MAFSFLIAAPQSGSGKTTLTLALLRALRRRGLQVGSAKAGPDYIDPAFHALAGGGSCVNLDPFAMRPDLLRELAGDATGRDGFVVEGMMGLFDGAADGTGSSGDLAAMLGLPVVLVVDCTRQSHSVAALVSGFARFREDVSVAGVILNRVASPRHELMLREALSAQEVAVFGAMPRDAALALPERHLGLVQAGEHGAFDAFADAAADLVTAHVDLDALAALSASMGSGANAAPATRLAPLGQNIAIACDAAFSFLYPHLVEGWQAQGATLSFFSPLADEAPDGSADAVFLPGGYPELHAARLAQSGGFLAGLRQVAEGGSWVYGECGGYMVLGKALIDAQGKCHEMAGLLPVVTSFEERRRHLGYRRVQTLCDTPLGDRGTAFLAHEFHYSTLVEDGPGERLFETADARGADLGSVGHVSGKVMGSYLHLIDRAQA